MNPAEQRSRDAGEIRSGGARSAPSTDDRTAQQPAPPRPTEPTFWDIRDIQFHCRVSRATAWRLVRRPAFPDPVVLSRREILWPRRDVLIFLERQRDGLHYVREADDHLNEQPVRAPFISRPL